MKAKLASAKTLAEVNVADYDAIFYPGGHGPVLDLATDPLNAKLASDFFRAGKVTAAVCHGPAALVGATDANGDSIFKGRRATAFSDAEEQAVDKVKVGAAGVTEGGGSRYLAELRNLGRTSLSWSRHASRSSAARTRRRPSCGE